MLWKAINALSCLLLVMQLIGAQAYAAVTNKSVFTDCADFATGSSTKTQCVSGGLQVTADGETSSNVIPVIWVPNSDTGSISKVDTLTGRELGRYWTAPAAYQNWNASPSRTTVDMNGNVWFGNRGLGTAVKIGLNENGQCMDRNGNGTIETSTDLNGDGVIQANEMLPWGEDECVLFEVLLDPSNPSAAGTYLPGTPGLAYNWFGTRGIAFDKNNNIWVGGWGSPLFYNLDGKTGQIIRSLDASGVGGGFSYGAFADSNGVIWSTNWGTFTRIDPNVEPPSVSAYPVPGGTAYGIAPDSNGNIVYTGFCNGTIGKFNTHTYSGEWLVSHPSLTCARGVAVSPDGDIWTANSGGNGVSRFDSNGVFKAVIPAGGPAGVSIDRERKVWAVDLSSDNIYRIDPFSNSVDLTKSLVNAGSHYGYSDMIGTISNATAQYQGSWTVDHDSGVAGKPWGTISWNATVPAAATITVKARSSEDQATWSAWETAVNGQLLSATPDGRYLEVRVDLSINQKTSSDFSLNDLTITPYTIPYSQRDGNGLTLTVNPVISPTRLASAVVAGAVEVGAAVSVFNVTANSAGTASVTGGSWLGSANLTPGSNTIRITATLGSMQVQQEVVVVNDRVPPTVTISAPQNGLTYKNPVSFNYSATDDDAVGGYLLKINGETVSTTQPGNNLTLTDGVKVIRLEATDRAGNVGFSEVSIFVDNVAFPPSIDTLPALWEQTSYTLRGKVEPGSAVSVTSTSPVTIGAVSVNGDSWFCTLSNLPNGPVTLNASAIDAVGNASPVTSAVLQVAVKLPQVSELQATDTYQGGKVFLDWSGYADQSRVSSYSLYYSDQPFTSVAGMVPFRTVAASTLSYNAVGLSNNVPAYFAAVAVDANGLFNASVAPVRVIPTRQGFEGYLTDAATGKPLQAIRVSVSSEISALSDGKGYYAISGLPQSTYNVTFSENPELRYLDVSKTVTLAAGQMVTLNAAMTLKQSLPPSVPANLTASGEDKKVLLSWSQVRDADLAGYNVYRGRFSSDPAPVKVNPGLVASTKYTDSGLVNGTAYWYCVRAVNNQGVEGAAGSWVSGTPVVALPDPPKDLKAELQCDGKVVLKWIKPASSNVTGYQVYFQSGTALDYQSPVIIQDAGITSWTSPVLEAGTYTFGIRTQADSLELNQNVVATVNVPASWGIPTAFITTPEPGKKVSGNFLHVQAQISACGQEEPSQVLFQYAPAGGTQWLDIPSASAQHSNPDTKGPAFFVKWDVTGLSEGSYRVRTVASNAAGVADPNPGAVTFAVDHAAPDYREDLDNKGQTQSTGVVEKDRENHVTVAAGDTGAGISFPVASLATDANLQVQIKDGLGAESTPTLLKAMEINLSSGQATFPAGSEPGISFEYEDNNNDGFVDNSGQAVDDLRVSSWNQTSRSWEPLSSNTVNPSGKTVSGNTNHFSLFALVGSNGLPNAEQPALLTVAGASSTGSYPLSWTEVPGAGIYQLQEATDSDFTQGVRTVFDGQSLSFSIAGRTDGVYWYRVRAGKTGFNPSAWTASNPVTVTLACGTPLNLSAQSNNVTGTVLLSWLSSEPEGTSYDVEIDNGNGYTPLATTGQKSIETTLGNGVYQFRVKARRAGAADSDFSSSVAVTMILACATPETISVADASGTKTIQWAASSTPGVSYLLQESVDGGSYQTIFIGTLTQVSLTDRLAAAYSYRVKASKSGFADSLWKATTNVLQCKPVSTLSVPSNNSTGSYSISWTASETSGVTYILYEGGTEIYRGTSTSFVVSGKTDGSYSYTVKATKSGYADSATTTSNSCNVTLACGAPGNLSVPANSTGTIYVAWSGSSTAGATYILEQSFNSGPWSQVYSGTNGAANLTVAAMGSYAFRVKAVKANVADSAYATSATLCTVALGAPGNLTVPANSTGAIYLAWSGSSTAGASYILEQSFNSGPWSQVYTGTDGAANLSVTAMGSYAFRVKATKANFADSAYATSATLCAVALGAPGNLSVPANSTGTIYVAWSGSSTAGAAYILEQSFNSGPWSQVYSGTNGAANLTVAAMGSYAFRVKATKANFADSAYATSATPCTVALGAPGNLTVPATSTGTIYVSWSGSSTAGASYILEQSFNSGTWSQVYTGTNCAATVPVTAMGSYAFRVKATKANFADSAYATSATVCTVAVGAPGNLTVPANSTGAIYLSWSGSSTAGATYILEQSFNNGTWSQVYTGTNSATNLTVAAMGSYAFRVKAVKASYADSAYATSATVCTVALGAPKNLSVPANSTGTIYVSWSGSSTAGASYILEQSLNSGTWSQVYSGTNSAASLTVTAMGSYAFRVKAVKASFADSAYATSATLCSVALGAPKNLTVPANSTGTIYVTWSGSSTAGAAYILEQSFNGGPWSQVYSGTNGAANLTVTAMGSYAYRVKATKANFADSAYATSATLCTVALGAPGNLTVPANSTGTIYVTWSGSSTAGATYILEQSFNSGPWSQVYSGTNGATNLTVAAMGSYAFRVKATKANFADSAYATSATLCTVALGAPRNLTVPANSTGAIYVSWSGSSTAGATYILEQSFNGGTWSQVYSGTNSAANLSVTAMGGYTFRVKAVKASYADSAYATSAITCTVIR